MPTTKNSCNQIITQYNVQTGDANNSLNQVAPSSTSGVPLISQGSSSQPTFGTAVVAGGGTGVASWTDTSALVCTGTSSTGNFQDIASVATGQVLVSAGTSTIPAWSAAPTVTSITFGSGTALSNYAEGTFTPTVTGLTTAGTTTYTTRTGFYTRIGNMVTCQGYMDISAATGTGTAVIGGFPFTVKNQSNYFPQGPCSLSSAANGFLANAGSTNYTIEGQINTTTAYLRGFGATTGGGAYSAMSNTSCKFFYSLTYFI